MAGAVSSSTTTGTVENSHTNSEQLNHLNNALDIIYGAQSTNAARKQATEYLEHIKALPDAASLGYNLALDKARTPAARYYGLSLLEDTIKYRSDRLGRLEQHVIRDWVTQLAERVEESDPKFLRNKVAHIWVEAAKKFWLEQWRNMDEMLVQLWDRSFTHQSLVLHVLEALSDECFSKEDGATSGRSSELGKACVEIFTPSNVLSQLYPERDLQNKYQCGQEGWFIRLLKRAEQCLDRYPQGQPEVKACLLQSLQVLRSIVVWIILRVISTTGCIALLSRAMQLQDVHIQIATLDVFHGLYHRTQYTDEEVKALVSPLLNAQGLHLVKTVYDDASCHADDIDEYKYILLKKLTETTCALGCFIEQRPSLMSNCVDVASVFEVLTHMLRNESLVVSIPILYLWTRLLHCKHNTVAQSSTPLIGSLLEIASQRLLKYESLNADSGDATLRFLDEDFDTMPERHAFVGNYRRFCTEIVERIVRKSPIEAMHHVLRQADALFDGLPQNADSASYVENYSSESIFALSVDAQCTVITSSVKGYLAGRNVEKGRAPESDIAHQQLQADVERWCTSLLERSIPDPSIHKRALQLCSELSTHMLDPDTNIPIAIGQRILGERTPISHISTPYGEAVKDLYAAQSRMLQKLAMKFPDKYMPVYDELKASIERIASQPETDQRAKMELRVIPFIIIHRTNLLSREQKHSRLQTIIEPILGAWQDPGLSNAVASFDSFCALLGLDRIPEYFLSSNAHRLDNWSSQPLSDEGLRLRDDINHRAEDLPLQPLKSLLMAATDRVRQGSEEYSLAAQLWEPSVPIVLPKVLQLVSHAHAYGNPRKWSAFPDEMHIIVQRTLVDRVWQSGISSETRDDFYTRVRESKKTLEGLASSTRAAIRGVRELSYWILHCMCQFGESFYSHTDLADPLAKALYEDADTLSSHQVSTLLRISMALIDGCPLHHRSQFLPPIISNLYRQVDRKLTTEWELLGGREERQTDDENLDAEMKIESVLRQLTFSAATLAATLISLHIEPYAGEPMRGLTLSSSSILSSLVIFSNHVLRMRDTRSCSLTTRILRNLIPEISAASRGTSMDAGSTSLSNNNNSGPRPPHPTSPHPPMDPSTAHQIREFFCTDVLKGAITSLHEPYFADLQKELGALIAAIIAHFGSQTPTPREIFLSLPAMTPTQIDRAFDALTHPIAMGQTPSERTQRTIVLSLLQSLRGVSIHEMGKIVSSSSATSTGLGTSSSRLDRSNGGVSGKMRTAMQEQFASMAVDGQGQDARIDRGGSAEIEGMGQLFE